MSRSILMFLLACSAGLAFSEEIETVRSWDHYRELMLADGSSADAAEARISRMLSSLRSMDRSAGSDRIGVPAPSFEFDGWLNSEPLSLKALRGRVVRVRCWHRKGMSRSTSAPAPPAPAA